jgi:hypothetical protein
MGVDNEQVRDIADPAACPISQRKDSLSPRISTALHQIAEHEALLCGQDTGG